MSLFPVREEDPRPLRGRPTEPPRHLVPQLVASLMHAQRELRALNGCQVTDDPDVPARLPAELKPVFWKADAGATRGR